MKKRNANRQSHARRSGPPCEIIAHPATLRRALAQCAQPARASRLFNRSFQINVDKLSMLMLSIAITGSISSCAYFLVEAWLSTPPPVDATVPHQFPPHTP